MAHSVPPISSSAHAPNAPVGNAPVSRCGSLVERVRKVFYGIVLFFRELGQLLCAAPRLPYALYRRCFPIPQAPKTNTDGTDPDPYAGMETDDVLPQSSNATPKEAPPQQKMNDGVDARGFPPLPSNLQPNPY